MHKFNEIVLNQKIDEITKLVDDLFWDFDRLTTGGQETLYKLADLLGIVDSVSEEGEDDA
jgi:hypothetical protein